MAARPASDFDETHQMMMPTEMFVKIVYEDLFRKYDFSDYSEDTVCSRRED